MIIQEQINGFKHTFSDQNKMIRKVGTDEIYCDAMDVLDFEYEETNEDIVLIDTNTLETFLQN